MSAARKLRPEDWIRDPRTGLWVPRARPLTLPSPRRRSPAPHRRRILPFPYNGIAPVTTNGSANGQNASTVTAGSTFAISFGSAVTLSSQAVVAYIGINTSSLGAASSPYITAPSGWTSIGSAVVASNTNSAVVIIMGWVCYGNNANKSFTNSTGLNMGADTFTWITQAFTGTDLTTIIDSTPATQPTNSGANSITISSWTVSNSGALPVAGVVDWNGGGASGFSATGYTAINAGSSSTMADALLYDNSTVTTTTGNIVINDNASATGNFLAAMGVALKPAASAATYQPYRDYNAPFWNWYEF